MRIFPLHVDHIRSIIVTPLQKSPAPRDCWSARTPLCVAVTPAGTGHEDASEASPPRSLEGENSSKIFTDTLKFKSSFESDPFAMQLKSTTCWSITIIVYSNKMIYCSFSLWLESKCTPCCTPGFPTFVIVHLVPVGVDHVGLQEAQESAGDKEAVWEGKVFDVTHVQGKRVGGRGNGAQAHQLTDNVPHTNTWLKKKKKNGTRKKKKAPRTFSTKLITTQ